MPGGTHGSTKACMYNYMFSLFHYLPELVLTAQRYCSDYDCSTPGCIHSRLEVNLPLETSPVKQTNGRMLCRVLGGRSAGILFSPYLCCRFSLGPYVGLVVFVMSESNLCRHDAWLEKPETGEK